MNDTEKLNPRRNRFLGYMLDEQGKQHFVMHSLDFNRVKNVCHFRLRYPVVPAHQIGYVITDNDGNIIEKFLE